jgi:hypothetical protein
MLMVDVRRVTMRASMSDADAAPKGIPACVAQAVVLIIRRR